MESQRLFDEGELSSGGASSGAQPIPKRQIALAAGLLLAGVLLLIIGLSLWTDPEAHSARLCFSAGWDKSSAHQNSMCRCRAAVRSWLRRAVRLQAGGMLSNRLCCRCLGSLCFLPGAYFSWIAFAAYTGRRGYSWSDIPG